ncbi:MAG: hypothetical protein RI911_656 [Candidatus Parcubacteria bacterium]|jgi:predicted Rossmann fold flavoprotein
MKAVQYDVVVVGGGAAGMLAAGRAAERGKRVLLLEKNKQLGEKLAITGGGRCNIANSETDVHALLRHYGDAAKFLYTPFAQFGVKETFHFFESRGLPLFVEDRKRVFPRSEHAPDVVRVLRTYLQKNGVTIKTGEPVVECIQKGNRVTAVRTKAQTYDTTHVILATGGVSHQETGSTGDGFDWLRALGHTVHEPTPTIVPVKIKERWIKDLAGVTLPQVKITILNAQKKVQSVTGDVLCTHFGISGPTVLNISTRIADAQQSGEVTLRLDMFPREDSGALDARLITYLDAQKNKILKNALKEFLPAGTSESLIASFPGIDGEMKVHSLSKEARKQFVAHLKSLTLHVTGLMGLDRAVIADGGVPLTEIDMKTFQSKKMHNLSVIGDLLHIRRPSGGYSLQLCWTSGWVAGESV